MISIDARAIRILMDINSLQSFGAVKKFGEQSNSTSLFTSMLNEALGESSLDGSLFGTMSSSNSLLYNGHNTPYKPEALASAIAQTQTQKTSTTKNMNAASYNGQYEDIINEAAEKYNLPSQLISSVIKHESNFNANNVSHAGAQGLMQLMPGTAKFLGVTNSFDPAQNVLGGAKYLRQMLNQFNGNIEHALAAYNAGPGNVRKYGGIPPFKETQNYVNRVMNTFNA